MWFLAWDIFFPASSYDYVLVGKRGEGHCVGLITLNRPKELNALCDGLMKELDEVLIDMDSDPSVAAIIITGSEKAFAAGETVVLWWTKLWK